jgi:hypothetical protein
VEQLLSAISALVMNEPKTDLMADIRFHILVSLLA